MVDLLIFIIGLWLLGVATLHLLIMAADRGVYLSDLLENFRTPREATSEKPVTRSPPPTLDAACIEGRPVGAAAGAENLLPTNQVAVPSSQNAIVAPPTDDLHWIDPSRATRLHNRQVSNALGEAIKQQEIATKFLQAATQHEHQRVAFREAQERALLIPHRIETEIIELQKRQRHAMHDAEVAAEELHDRQRKSDRRRQLEEKDHEIAMLKREVQIQKLDGMLVKPAPARQPAEEPKPEPEPVVIEPAFQDLTPEALRRHLAEEDEVRANRAEADRRVYAIYNRAATEGRDITDDEQDEVDNIKEALARAEAEIRQGGASDLP